MGQCHSLEFHDPAMLDVHASKVAIVNDKKKRAPPKSRQKAGLRETSLALTTTTDVSSINLGDQSPSQRRLPRRRKRAEADPLRLPGGGTVPFCVTIPTNEEQRQQKEAGRQKEAAQARKRTEISATNAALLRRLDHNNKRRSAPLKVPSFSSLNSNGNDIGFTERLEAA